MKNTHSKGSIAIAGLLVVAIAGFSFGLLSKYTESVKEELAEVNELMLEQQAEIIDLRRSTQEEPTVGAFRPSGYTGKLLTRLNEGGSETTFRTTPNEASDGSSLSTAKLGDFIVITVNPGADNEEKISVSAVSTSTGGIATWTVIDRGLSFTENVAVTANKKQHSIGETVIISDDDHFLVSQYTSTDSTATITAQWVLPNPTASTSPVNRGYLENNAMMLTTNQSASGNKTFTGDTTHSGATLLTGTTTIGTSTIVSAEIASGTISKTPVSALDIVNKDYADNLSFAGASNADETTKGLVEEGTQAEVNAGTATGGTGASLYVAPDKLGGGVATYMAFYSATSTTDSNINSISMTADDVLLMWAQFDADSCISGSGNFVTGSLIYKQSNLGASTTVSTVEDAHAAGGSRKCNAVAIGKMTATTTMTVNVSADISAGNYSSLLVQHFIR